MPVSAVINHAYDRGWCSLIRLKRFKEEKPKRRPAATLEWMILFLRQCKIDRLPHLAALVLFMNRTAARISEAVNVRWDDIDLVNRKVILRKTKTGKNSVRHLTDDLIAKLYELRNNHEEGPFKYRCRHSVNERLKAVCRRAGIRYLPSHYVGRRAYAKNTVALGIDTKSAMDGGGWVSSKVFLEIYVQGEDGGRVVAERFNSHRYDLEA
jgi:integrase